ncbi:MAG TPA: F390 synthetase-related protein [Roseiflexaceae bacterium]|nr:F390 synthetase-related protein [Roseiflexaceae bacterium]
MKLPHSLQAVDIGRHWLQARWRWAQLSRANLETYQAARISRITAYAQRRAPFYRDLWRGHDLARWQALPTVDKRLMMENFTDFNTRGVEREAAMRVALAAERRRDFTPTITGLTVGLSSGTSGHRGLFLVSPAEQRAWAGTILARTLHQRGRRPYRVAFFLRSNSNLYEHVDGRLVRLRYFDLMLPLEQAIEQLNDFQPQLLVGPPSLLGLLADASGSSLHIAPERLISVAEVLEPQDREHLQHCFGAPVHQIYQCTEGLIAVSCAHGSLHIQEDLVALQLEPIAGDPERFTPIVTDLWRTTQPIVRYRLNDVLTLCRQQCPCGSDFRVLASIDGRCDDLFDFPTRAGGLRPVFPDLIRRMILLSSPDIVDYQALQDRCGQIQIRLDIRPESDWAAIADTVRRSVQATLASYDLCAAEIELARGMLPVAPGAKRRRVWRRQALHP